VKAKRIAFQLSMPGRGSWDGKWSGEDRLYVVVRLFRDQKKADEILAAGSYSYRWEDGWAARVSVKEVTAAEERSLLKRSNGFCGYVWMVNRIIDYGRILADHELPEQMACAAEAAK
jgi:hypothetical protein